MTTYTKRDIRAADMLAIILFGFGLILVCFAVWSTAVREGRRADGLGDLWIVAGAFVMLGLALNLKVRELIRNKGVEPADYDGVPD